MIDGRQEMLAREMIYAVTLTLYEQDGLYLYLSFYRSIAAHADVMPHFAALTAWSARQSVSTSMLALARWRHEIYRRRKVDATARAARAQ